MFTGIITDVGEVVRFDNGRLVIRTRYKLTEGDIGASIACDGCCLTVTAFEGHADGSTFHCDVSNETLSRTTLGNWSEGEAINLEQALTVRDRLGGHIVAGHVDGVGKIISKTADGESLRFELEAPASLAPFIAEKGSIALDGISLTVNAVTGNRFTVNLIPHTLTNTSWGVKKPGQSVNIEVDVFARYVARLMEFRS